VVAGFSQCPAGLPVPQSKQKCNTGVYIQSWNSHHLNEPLRYERNAQGDMSSIRCYDLDGAGNCKQHSGPFVRNGCSLMPKADGSPRPLGEKVPDSTVVAMVCADCEVMSATFASDATLKCVCPGYSKKLTDTDNRIQSKSLVDFKQCDPRWKCHPYAGHSNLTSTCSVSTCTQGQMSNNICISGCGLVTTAMVVNYHGHPDITPPLVADKMVAAGFRDDKSDVRGATCNGVSHTAICATAKSYGLKCQVSSDPDDLDIWLDATGPVIAHLRHKAFKWCKFTTTGHYVVVSRKIDESTYTVSDPNSQSDHRKWATMEDLVVDCQLVGFIKIAP